MPRCAISKNSLISVFLTVIILALATTICARPKEDDPPIPEEGMIKLLDDRTTASALIIAIERRGVGFELTDYFEKELKSAATYLRDKEFNSLLKAIRANFRPPRIRPFRITYLILKGHALDLLMNRNIRRQWNRVLGGGQYFIIENRVSNNIAELRANFSESFNGDKFLRKGAAPGTSRKLAASYEEQGKEMFVGSGGEVSAGESQPSLSSANLISLTDSLEDPGETWRVRVFRTKSSDFFVFRKFVSRRDLDAFTPTTLQKFYAHITRKYMPPDFGVVEMTTIEDGCPIETTWNATWTGPLLRLNVAIIENVSNEPVSIGKFIVKEHDSDRPQTRAEARAALDSQPAEKRDLWRPGILKAGESLVIPVEMSLKASIEPPYPYTEEFSRVVAPSGYPDVLKRVRAAGGIEVRIDQPAENSKRAKSVLSRIDPETLERIMSRGELNFSPREYLYGPSFSLESIQINKFDYAVRRFDPSSLFIISGHDDNGEVVELEAGSCPYIYTYASGQKTWSNEGVILYGYNSKLKESTDEMVLHHFDGRILIQEKDPETSFLDSIQIRAVGRDDRQTILHPKNAKLLSADGDYVQLTRGEQLMVDFDLPTGFVAHRLVLELSGYYEPNPDGRTQSPRRRPMRR